MNKSDDSTDLALHAELDLVFDAAATAGCTLSAGRVKELRQLVSSIIRVANVFERERTLLYESRYNAVVHLVQTRLTTDMMQSPADARFLATLAVSVGGEYDDLCQKTVVLVDLANRHITAESLVR